MFILSLILCLSQAISAQVSDTFKDQRDNKVYNTLKIGSQWWMVNYLEYEAKSGSRIGTVEKDGYNMEGLRLYTWKTAKDVCPKGWKLPSKDDFNKLLLNFGMPEISIYKGAIDAWTWKGELWDQVKEYVNGYNWTSSEVNANEAWAMYCTYNSAGKVVAIEKANKAHYIGIHCIRSN